MEAMGSTDQLRFHTPAIGEKLFEWHWKTEWPLLSCQWSQHAGSWRLSITRWRLCWPTEWEKSSQFLEYWILKDKWKRPLICKTKQLYFLLQCIKCSRSKHFKCLAYIQIRHRMMFLRLFTGVWLDHISLPLFQVPFFWVPLSPLWPLAHH